MNMDINLSPEKGTILNIPLNSTSDVSQSDFITFIDKSRKSDDEEVDVQRLVCLLYTSPSPRDRTRSRMPSSA